MSQREVEEVCSSQSSESGELSPRGLDVLRSLDSRCFGFLGIHNAHSCKGSGECCSNVGCTGGAGGGGGGGDRPHEANFVTREFILAGIKKLMEDTADSTQPSSYHPDILCHLGHLHLLLEDYCKALSAYQQYQTLYPVESAVNVNFLYGLGLIYFHYRSYRWAIEVFQSVLRLAPNFARGSEVHLRLGVIFKKRGEYERSLEHFKSALTALGPSSLTKLEIQFHIGHLHFLQRDYLAAKATFEGILSSKSVPNGIKSITLKQLGWLYHTIPEVASCTPDPHGKATELLTLAVGADPTAAQAWYFLGRCHSQQGHFHEAFLAYQHAINNTTDGHADTWCSIGLLYHKMAQPRDSLQSYLCAVYLDPYNLASWINMGCLYEAMAQPVDALLAYKNAAVAIRNSKKHISTISSADHVFSRLSNLEQYVYMLGPSVHNQPRSLPSLSDAWTTLVPPNVKGRRPPNVTPILQLPNLPPPPPTLPPHPPPPHPPRLSAPPSKRARLHRNKEPIIIKNINEGWSRHGLSASTFNSNPAFHSDTTTGAPESATKAGMGMGYYPGTGPRLSHRDSFTEDSQLSGVNEENFDPSAGYPRLAGVPTDDVGGVRGYEGQQYATDMSGSGNMGASSYPHLPPHGIVDGSLSSGTMASNSSAGSMERPPTVAPSSVLERFPTTTSPVLDRPPTTAATPALGNLPQSPSSRRPAYLQLGGQFSPSSVQTTGSSSQSHTPGSTLLGSSDAGTSPIPLLTPRSRGMLLRAASPTSLMPNPHSVRSNTCSDFSVEYITGTTATSSSGTSSASSSTHQSGCPSSVGSPSGGGVASDRNGFLNTSGTEVTNLRGRDESCSTASTPGGGSVKAQGGLGSLGGRGAGDSLSSSDGSQGLAGGFPGSVSTDSPFSPSVSGANTPIFGSGGMFSPGPFPHDLLNPYYQQQQQQQAYTNSQGSPASSIPADLCSVDPLKLGGPVGTQPVSEYLNRYLGNDSRQSGANGEEMGGSLRRDSESYGDGNGLADGCVVSISAHASKSQESSGLAEMSPTVSSQQAQVNPLTPTSSVERPQNPAQSHDYTDTGAAPRSGRKQSSKSKRSHPQDTGLMSSSRVETREMLGLFQNQGLPLFPEEISDSGVSSIGNKPSTTSCSSENSSPRDVATSHMTRSPVTPLFSPQPHFSYPSSPEFSPSSPSCELLDPIPEPFPSLGGSAEYMAQSPELQPPRPPRPRAGMDLHPQVERYEVKDWDDAHSMDLHAFCSNPDRPICIIQGLCPVLGLNLDLFSSDSLVQTCADHEIEVRDQIQQAADENTDPSGRRQVWKCESNRSFSTIKEYAGYQKMVAAGQDDSPQSDCSDSPGSDSPSSGKTRTHNRRPRKMIRFGTNVDLSDSNKWEMQLEELKKLPKFCRISCPEADFLTHIGHTILGMNSVQLYMKVPGARTPGHQENINFCSVNINIGPGDCEWFAVHNQYWGVFHRLCEKHKICFLTGSWWPILSELADLKVPVYRFTQYVGEVVWLNPGTVHWVQANSVCNNIAWNIGPLTAHQFRMSWERYQWNKIQKVRSIVPMVHMIWNLVQSVKIVDETLYKELRSLLERSVLQSRLLLSQLSKSNIPVHWHGREEGEPAPCCSNCMDEVFNILFVVNHRGEYLVYCHKCATSLKKSFAVLQQYKLEELEEILETFRLHPSPQAVST